MELREQDESGKLKIEVDDHMLGLFTQMLVRYWYMKNDGMEWFILIWYDVMYTRLV